MSKEEDKKTANGEEGGKAVFSLRLPKSELDEVGRVANEFEMTRNSLIKLCVRYFLKSGEWQKLFSRL